LRLRLLTSRSEGQEKVLQPEYLFIALSALGLLLRTRAAHFRDAYHEASANEKGLREAVAELRYLRASEARARREAEEAARVKSQFLAHVSHEVRTPLQAISGAAQLLQETTLTAEQQEVVDMLATGSETLQAILGDILDYARIEAGKIDLDPRPIHLQDALAGAMTLLQPQAQARGLQLVHRVGPNVPTTISADPLRLRQVLLNLLSNAVKFTERGSVTLTVSRISGENGSTPGAPTLQFAVRDTGPGVSPQQEALLFQPFAQGPDGHEGAGLGLAISKELVTLMGGAIWHRSDPGRGATFTFTLPLETATGGT
jgi:signal transduction histidine kinase